MAGFTVESEDVDYKIEIMVHYDADLDPQVPWNALARCCGDAEDEMNNRIMAYLNKMAAAEANEIIATTPQVKAWQTPPKPGPGRPPRDNAYFGHLTPIQASTIRRRVREKGDDAIDGLMNFYGVERVFIMRVLGRKE